MCDSTDQPLTRVRSRRPDRPARPIAGAILVVVVTSLCCGRAANAQSGNDGNPLVVTDGRVADLENSSFQAYVGTVALPADGIWSLTKMTPSGSAREFYLSPPPGTTINQLGNRMFAAFQKEQIDRDRWDLRVVYESCRQFAQQHDGRGPKSLSELDQDERQRRTMSRWKNRNWRQPQLATLVDDQDNRPVAFLVPEARFRFSESDQLLRRDDNDANRQFRRTVSMQDRDVLAFELRPLVDDGQHWVLYTDGSCERVAVDQELFRRHDVQMDPVLPKDFLLMRDLETLDYQVVLIADTPPAKPVVLTAQNHVLGETQLVNWQVDDCERVDSSALEKAIAGARRVAWRPYSQTQGGSILSVWQNDARAVERPQNPRRNLSMFSLLGGRAAIEETLQMQNLVVVKSNETEPVDVTSLKGVEVKSHPFKEMLAGRSGGDLELAQLVPHDRFFVYVGIPESLSAMLDSGAPFIASAGTSLTGNQLKYDLESKYLSRLGMSRDWVDAVLQSGLTSELAVFTPDLFFIDGTDVTVIAKLKQPQLFQKLLTVLGASGLAEKDVLEIPTTGSSASGGKPAYLALRDDMLFASTNREELDLSLGLLQSGGQASLGQSDEFRYMLTKLPVSESTRIYAYFSDPFIRNLVGPQTKLAQLRRVIARAKMEFLTARVLLAKLDGHPDPFSIAKLRESGHLPVGWQSEDLTITQTGLVSSERYGTLPNMPTLREAPVRDVTPDEAEAYRRYVQNYSRFWRQFFDPIAIRLNESAPGELELSTFILPLVDNSIYNALRMVLASQDNPIPLRVPNVEPSPVLQFSANLNEQAWQMFAGSFTGFFTRYSGASSAMLDDFGPSIHVAIFDADPIIAMGSGDLFSSFGGNTLSGRGSEMLMLPVALSMLTRPCSIMVETKSPERTARYLRQAAIANQTRLERDRDFGVSFYQVDDRDEWVWTMDLFGVINLRYGIEVVDNYLVLRNIPWSSDDEVAGASLAELNAASLHVSPSACEKQLPGLFAAASDAKRKSVMSGISRLYPLLLGGDRTVDQAADEHKRLFGFYPRRDSNDQWIWKNQRLISSDYGQPDQQRQPAFDPAQPFGLMSRIDEISINMQFEDDGLRSNVKWRLR